MTSRKAVALAPLAAALALALACAPDPAARHREAADALLQRADFAGAALEFERSLALDPTQEKLWEKLAFCRVKAGERDRAAEALVRLAELKPAAAQKAEVYRNAAGIFLTGGAERARAERYLVEVVRLDPADEESLAWLGELASEAGGARHPLATAVPEELDEALAWYDRLLALRPDSTSAHANRRVAVQKYLAHLDEQRRLETARLKRARRDAAAAAEARERIARADARAAELQILLAESDAKLAGTRKTAAR